MRETLPAAVWNLPPDALKRELEPRITRELVEEAVRKVYRRLSFAGVRVRSYDLQEVDLTAGAPISEFWHVDGAHLIDGREDAAAIADLACAFENKSGGEIRLTRTLKLPFAIDRLHRIQLFLRPDDSWHALEFIVEKQGVYSAGNARNTWAISNGPW